MRRPFTSRIPSSGKHRSTCAQLTRAAVAIVLGATAACVGPTDPNTPSPFPVQLQVESAADPALRAVLDKVEDIEVRLTRNDASVTEIVSVRVDGATVQGRFIVTPPPGDGPITVAAALRVDGATVFRGEALATSGRTDGLTLTVRPVPSTLITSGPVTLNALNEGVPLTSQVFFATGDPWLGAETSWMSNDRDIVTIEGPALAVPHANGTTELTATFQQLTRTVPFTVSQIATTLSGLEPADTTVTVGATFPTRVYGQDSGGYPLLPGAVVTWAWGSGVTVDASGVVTATAAGSTFVRVLAGGQQRTMTLTILPPP